MKRTILPAAVAVLALTGCAEDFSGQRGDLFAGFGGMACGALSGFNPGFRHADCARIGRSIGRSLDAADRKREQFAVVQALQQRLPARYYQPGGYQVAGGYGGASPADPGRSRSPLRPASSTATDEAAPAKVGRFPGLTPVQGATWVSDHSGTSGSVEVIAAEKPANGRGECRTLVQTVRQPGQAAASDTAKFCESRAGASDWTKI